MIVLVHGREFLGVFENLESAELKLKMRYALGGVINWKNIEPNVYRDGRLTAKKVFLSEDNKWIAYEYSDS